MSRVVGRIEWSAPPQEANSAHPNKYTQAEYRLPHNLPPDFVQNSA